MNSSVLPIANYCPSAGKWGKADEDVELRKEFGKGASFNVNETQSLDDVTHRVEHGEPLRPYGHGTDGSEKSWHEDEDDEEYDEEEDEDEEEDGDEEYLDDDDFEFEFLNMDDKKRR